MTDDDRRRLGQWMTDGDPFYSEHFAQWLHGIVITTACEPYAGTLKLVSHLISRYPDAFSSCLWSAYDIDPPSYNSCPDIEVKRMDTLMDIPGHYDAIITNPPYLARVSASRRKIPIPDSEGVGIRKPTDIYQYALDACLASADYVAAIIPESFITSRYDKSRCDMIISLIPGLFEDTTCPVCLALFSPNTNRNTIVIGTNGEMLGDIDTIMKTSDALLLYGDDGESIPQISMRMTDPHGDISLIGIDKSDGEGIHFDKGDIIKPENVKISSRSLTRISRTDGIPFTDKEIAIANELITTWRHQTGDVLMTSFKSARNDGHWRRRISFSYACMILSKAIYLA